MDEGKAAPCELFRWATGGVKTLCDIAYDCGQCHILHRWATIMMSEGWSLSWECITCINAAMLEEKRRKRDRGGTGKLVWVPGYFQSARDPSLEMSHQDFDRDRPQFTHCMACGWTNFSFLQIILRRDSV